MIKLELTPNQVNLILDGLLELPAKRSIDLIKSIQNNAQKQINEQLNEQQNEQKEKTKPIELKKTG